MLRGVAILLAVALVGVAAFLLARETAPRDDAASHQGGLPNLFCTRTSKGRYQVLFWTDEVEVYDRARPHEPIEATYVVPATLKR